MLSSPRSRIHKAVATCAVAGAFIALTSTADAAKKVFHYEGSLPGTDPAAVVGFDVVKRSSGAKKVKNFWVHNLPFSCDNNTSGYTPWPQEYPGAMPVQAGGVFSGFAEYNWANGDPNTPMPGPFTVEGDLDRGGVAAGTVQRNFQYEGNSGTVHCSSGVRGWEAERVSAPQP